VLLPVLLLWFARTLASKLSMSYKFAIDQPLRSKLLTLSSR